jgi:succinate dehydrogenase / fumarate reductase iron-sulfur subunit
VRVVVGNGQFNNNKCCTEVCPEHIKITDNAIIPMKERIVDRRYDPIGRLVHALRRRRSEG